MKNETADLPSSVYAPGTGRRDFYWDLSRQFYRSRVISFNNQFVIFHNTVELEDGSVSSGANGHAHAAMIERNLKTSDEC
ncbi:hypothetical protein [Paraburkholderia terrae]|uniref:hypothetical protein n=1 Tax=Paraburkholderia terrae TaxID=311230 RepID=UPI0012E068EB|nr:hypothetical protein [Paraburkholderia terrae]